MDNAKYEKFIVTVMFLLFGVLFMDRLAVVYLFPFIAPELGLNNTQLGLIAAVLAVAFAISNIVFASIADFIGRKKHMLIIFIFAFSVATLLSGLIGGFISLLVIRIIMGITEGPVVPLVNAAVMAESQPKRRGFNMGIVQSAAPLFGGALVPVAVVAIANSLDWRYAFFILAIPGVLIGLVLMRYMREPVMREEVDGVLTEQIAARPSKKDYLSVLTVRNIRINIGISLFFMIFYTTMTAFSALFLINVGSYTESQASMYLLVLGLGMFIWNLVAPLISDKIGRKPSLTIFTFISILIPVSLMYLHEHFILLLIATFIFSAGMGYQTLSVAVIPAESVPKGLVTTAIGVTIFLGELIGGTLGPLSAGILADLYSFYAPLWVVAAACTLAFLLSFGIKETAPMILARRKQNPASVGVDMNPEV
ncbi:MFS transporter [Lysinibacillus yapensis]|uniref:MFS transporter n=1 Tax=Ureibacillus yapensis TaxID=2304605 RepID=A0A396SEK5_9BACL|nr:MFS transporter [Lysinibacillus yapensis]RHW38446.1 MFS transporter [Lysinibacillus yapensis]